MPLTCATHSGAFHADDVLAFALIREFVDPAAEIVRSRDPDTLAACDVVFDVGGVFDPVRGRFDHHQNDYDGPLSSAGMVLAWIESNGRIDAALAARLRHELVDYVDAVDTGRRTPAVDVPCFAAIVGSLTNERGDDSGFDDRYAEAVAIARSFVRGIRAAHTNERRAADAVRRAMDEARAEGRRVLYFDEYLRWKRAYFDYGGGEHPTDFVLFPAEGGWRLVAIPPHPGSFAQKVPLPESWAGLSDDTLAAVVGVPGARFCHKNRFIAVFATRDDALAALALWGLDRPAPDADRARG